MCLVLIPGLQWVHMMSWAVFSLLSSKRLCLIDIMSFINSGKKLTIHTFSFGVFFRKKYLMTNSTSLTDTEFFRFSTSSCVSFGKLCLKESVYLHCQIYWHKVVYDIPSWCFFNFCTICSMSTVLFLRLIILVFFLFYSKSLLVFLGGYQFYQSFQRPNLWLSWFFFLFVVFCFINFYYFLCSTYFGFNLGNCITFNLCLKGITMSKGKKWLISLKPF